MTTLISARSPMGPPDLLYKYLPPPGATQYAKENLDLLLGKSKIRLTSACEVNDVFERNPVVSDDLDENLVCDVFERVWDHGPAGRINSDEHRGFRRIFPERADIRAAPPLEWARAELVSSRRILKWFKNDAFYSLAERPDCPLMWAYYASSHSGICVGFDTAGVLFPRLALPVRYSEDRPTVSASALLNAAGSALAPETLEAILLTKGVYWAYEREWRFLGWHPRENYFARGGEWIDISPTIIRQIIFGVNCTDETRRVVRNLVSAMNNKPIIMHARRSTSNFSIDIVDDNI